MTSSARSTPRHTPVPTSSPHEIRRVFEPDASIVLIGMRGTGKSTLAVIASMACQRRVVDIDDLFREATGFSTAKYRKQFGASNHNLRQEELMQDFAATHPIIHIVRDLYSIHEYLGGVELRRLRDMLAFSAPILRRCSNYEFYNVPELAPARSNTPSDQPIAPTFLTAVQVPLSDLLAEDVDIQSLHLGSDAFEVVVDPPELDPHNQRLQSERADDISKCISRIRRSAVVPILYHVLPSASRDYSKESYLEHVRHGLRMAPEFISIDLSLDAEIVMELIASRGRSKVIGHLHADESWDHRSWGSYYETAVRLGCDVVSLLQHRTSRTAFDVLQQTSHVRGTRIHPRQT